MPRFISHLLVCLAALLAVSSARPAPPEDDLARKKEVLLALQSVLQKGRDHLQKGHFKAAVDILEIPLANGELPESRDYLRALTDAYLGYIVECRQANNTTEADRYQRRLARLDPGALLELKGNTSPAPKPAAVPAPAPNTIRAQAKDDPFDAGNSVPVNEAKALLDRAEQEFDARHYEGAAKLFEQAERTSKSLITPAVRERWAYCKLGNVVAILNRQAYAPPELEQEVRLAMSMAANRPELMKFGQDLLGRIKERRGTTASLAPSTGTDGAPELTFEVRHMPRQANGWAVAETANFRVYHNQPPDVAEKAAKLAETARLTAAKKWFGEPLAAWPQRCDVYLHATAQDYSQATGQPPQCPGHSTMPMEGERVLGRRLDLHCDDSNMSIGVLPHEVTHVVLAGRFPGALPRWADEGMAVLSEPRDRVERHLRNLPMHSRQGELFGSAQLLGLDNYPPANRVGAFYAQSVSLVEFLSKLQGPPVFSQFMTDGMRSGFEPALRKHYKFNSFADLDAAWQRATLGDAAARGN